MKKSWIIGVIVIVIAAIGIYAFMSSSTPPSGTGTDNATGTVSTGTSSSPTGVGNMVPLALNTETDAKLGTILVAADGMTLYKFSKDAPNVSNCTGACAVTWPPYMVSQGIADALAGGTGVTGKIGTIKRADGSLQVTYNGAPLYFFAKDKNPGDTLGQGVLGIWFVVKP